MIAFAVAAATAVGSTVADGDNDGADYICKRI